MEAATDDLNWLAQRYVLDELDAAEAAAFEDCLRDDERAAAALAAAVRTIAAVKVGSGMRLARLPPAAATIRSPARGWLAAAGAAVALGLAVVLVPMLAARHALDVSPSAAELVGRWRDFPMSSALGGGLATHGPLPAQEQLPRWLVAAVTISGETGVAKETN